MRILVVDDEFFLRQGILPSLHRQGHAVDEAENAQQAEELFATHEYHLILLDLGLPDKEGLELLQKWRASGFGGAILILTAKDSIPARVQGLQAGADDYLVKPFALEELLARVQALGRRGPALQDLVLEVGDLSLNVARGEVRRAGVLLPLRAREFAVLQVLMQRKGRIVSRDQLRESCWAGEADGGSNVEEATVSSLRRKLGKPALIKTRRGFGYLIDVS